jgi:hypothetical protein
MREELFDKWQSDLAYFEGNVLVGIVFHAEGYRVLFRHCSGGRVKSIEVKNEY